MTGPSGRLFSPVARDGQLAGPILRDHVPLEPGRSYEIKAPPTSYASSKERCQTRKSERARRDPRKGHRRFYTACESYETPPSLTRHLRVLRDIFESYETAADLRVLRDSCWSYETLRVLRDSCRSYETLRVLRDTASLTRQLRVLRDSLTRQILRDRS